MNEKRLIDADALYSEIARIYSEHYEKSAYKFIHDFSIATLKRIRKAPTVNATEVIRCKDCKYFNKKTSVGGFCKCGEVCGGIGFMRINEDFCSYGELKNS